jgi:uncharacterized protein with PIN domain
VEPSRAWFRFYAELNDHLAPEEQFQSLEKTFFVAGSVKDMIESFGVPHTEVELILVNGESADFCRQVRNGDRVAVYPVFESFDVASELRVRPEPLRDPRFVLDVHLGKLAGYLRMLGFDAAYSNSATDPELAQRAAGEQRILLTRDRGLLMHGSVTRGYWLRETDSRRQAAEIVRRFDLARLVRPFTRCMACNAILQTAEPVEVQQRLPARITELYEHFLRCPGCGRIYWQGSHYRRMKAWIAELAGLPTG